MADAREPRKKKAAPRAADELRRPHLADDLRRPTSAADLRRQAEERLAELSAGAAAASAPEELAAGVHELRVNQIELEMQTEELLRAQLELEEQRAKYFDLFDLAPVGYLTINEKGIVGEANLTAARLLGVERQNLDGQRFSAFVFAADRDAHYLCLRKLRESGEPQACELRLLRPDGSPHWALLDATAVRIGEGAPVSRVTLSDISARKRAEDELSESEVKYREVVERANDGIAILQGGRVVFANEALARMSGYSTDELAGMPFRAGAREGRDEIEQRVRRRLAGEDVPSAHEIDLLRKDGKSFTAEASAGVIAYEGAPAELVLLRDVTARKRAEAELRDSEALSRSILSASPDDITTTDLEGRVCTVSPGGVRMFGLESEAAALGHSLGEFVVPEDRQRAAANVALMHQGVSAGPSEYGGLRADGSTFAIEVNGKLIRDVHEQPTGMVFIVRDITARKQTEQLLAVPAEILAILAVSAPLRETVDGIVTVLKRATCLDAVGLRLLEGDDYPFTAAVGYSDDFLQAENSMAVRYPDGGLCRNEDGSVRLECTCGLVLSGDTDPAGSLFTAGGSAFTNDAHPLLGLPPEEDPRLHPRNRCIHAGFLSIALVPLRAGTEILGMLHFADRRKDRFTAESISLLEGVGASIGVALLRKRAEENLARSAAELREQLHDTVKTMGAIVSLRDPYTAAHELRVTELAVAIAHEMGLDEETCEGLAFAGEVHDIGKIGIPAEILSKPGALTAMEYALIKEHPQAGRELLAAIRFRQPVAEIVGQHQERLDGSGYPDGLKGDEIMLEARILAVADVVEAMASHRPYRAALGLEAALAEVRSGAGGRYDAVVVAACERVFAEGFIFSES